MSYGYIMNVLSTPGDVLSKGLWPSHANDHDIRSGIFRGRVMDISTGRLIEVELKCIARGPDLIVNHFYRAPRGVFMIYIVQLYIHIYVYDDPLILIEW